MIYIINKKKWYLYNFEFITKNVVEVKKFLGIIILYFFIISYSFATHNRAGEITYEQVSQYTYKITLITYTYRWSEANAQRDFLDMVWGDNTTSQIKREEVYILPEDEDIQRNTYKGTHTFPGPGIYQMSMSDPNRNADIVNIPNSVNVMFTLRTTLKIDPDLGYNNTPVLLNPPVDKAAKGRVFIHNPAAFDADGDSISYKLATCLGDNGLPIPGYSLPDASNTIYVDEITGDFVWNTPMEIGEYNVAMEIEEWRNGVKIGSIIRDMQIEVQETDNAPPTILPLQDYCVTAGDTLTFDVTATDANNDNIKLSASGGLFTLLENPASFPEVTGSSPITGNFSWKTSCSHIRLQSYTAIFRAEDLHAEVHLTDYKESKITVVAPAPQNLTASPSSNTVYLSWDDYECTNAKGILIYRKKGSYNYTPPNCETGIPKDGGYELIDTVTDINTSEYLDNGTGNGLTQGYDYCYRVVAYFNDNAKSYVSNESCAELIKGTPVFVETSVTYTDKEKGCIHLKWMKPTEFDATIYPGPYKYVIESSDDMYGENYSSPVDIFGINDTTYIDTLINTFENAKSYKLTLYTQTGSTWQQVGTPSYTASVFASGEPDNQKMKITANENTPWTNYQYIIYRKDAGSDCNTNSAPYDSVGYSETNTYTDFALENEKPYWFKIKTVGKYDLDFIPAPLYNFSQEICVAPKDEISPCPVRLTLDSDCDNMQNNLSWELTDSCSKDVAKFLIFYSDNYGGELELLETIDDYSKRSYSHVPENSLAGCYAVSAQDSAGNYILPENLVKTCIDECLYYELPNVFTPDGDGVNDEFIPLPYKFVEKVELKIYNRWGTVVFETTDPDINWKGIDISTGKPVSDGIYYYICDVYEQRLKGVEARNITGFIHIFGSKNSAKN